MSPRICIALSWMFLFAVQLQVSTRLVADDSQLLRIGMIGLDTSHAPAFTEAINSPKATGHLAKMKVVAAFPGGSDDLQSSYQRVEGFTEKIRGMGVEIVDSIDALLPKVDVVLLESVDGRKHLPQVLPVFKAGKPVFIDKPLGSNLTEAVAIDLLGKKFNARWFSSSSLRFSPSIIRFRENDELSHGIRAAISWSPCSMDPTHADLFWYGVHGVESLYTAMGPGCESVTRVDGQDVVVVGKWSDGRLGTYHGIRGGKSGYGLAIFGEKPIDTDATYSGYQPLLERIGEFFAGGPLPVSNAETIEMFTFMQAADQSKAAGGAPIMLADVLKSATEDATKEIESLLP